MKRRGIKGEKTDYVDGGREEAPTKTSKSVRMSQRLGKLSLPDQIFLNLQHHHDTDCTKADSRSGIWLRCVYLQP